MYSSPGITRDPDFGILDRTLTIHRDGDAWTVVPSPVQGNHVNNDFWGVVGFNPNNVWAVGAVGVDLKFVRLIENWDGTAWTPVRTQLSDGTLLGLTGIGSPVELWATGYRTKHNLYTGTFAEHLCNNQ